MPSEMLTQLLTDIINALEVDDSTRASMLYQVAADPKPLTTDDGDTIIDDHEGTVESGAAGITFTLVRQSRPSSVFIAWEGVAGVSGHGYYHLQFSTSADEADLIYEVETQTNWIITDALDVGTSIFVRGRVVDAAGHEGTWGSWTELESLAIITGDIDDSAVTTAKIDSLAVTTAKIDDLAVTDAKIDSLTAGKITAGTITATVTMTSPDIRAGGGAVVIDDNGIRLDPGTSAVNEIRWGLQGAIYVTGTGTLILEADNHVQIVAGGNFLAGAIFADDIHSNGNDVLTTATHSHNTGLTNTDTDSGQTTGNPLPSASFDSHGSSHSFSHTHNVSSHAHQVVI